MTERNFLRYRLEVVSLWPDSEVKRATIAAIRHRMAAQ